MDQISTHRKHRALAAKRQFQIAGQAQVIATVTTTKGQRVLQQCQQGICCQFLANQASQMPQQPTGGQTAQGGRPAESSGKMPQRSSAAVT